MADTPVEELVAELGFDVDRNAMDVVTKGLQQIETAAERAVDAVNKVGEAVARGTGGRIPIAISQDTSIEAARARFEARRAGFSTKPVEPEKPELSPLEKERARVLKQRETKALREQVLTELDGPKAPAKPELTPLEKERARVLKQRETKALREQVLTELDGPKVPKAVAETKEEVRGLTGMLEKAQRIAHAFMGLFAVRQIQHFAHELASAASQVEQMSKRLGVTTDEMQELQHAANMSDVSVETLSAGLKTLQINSTKAAEGSKAQRKAFQDLGVSVKGADGQVRPAQDLLEDVADAIASMEDPAKQTALAVRVFGAQGAAMVPMLQEGGEGIRKMREEAVALGGGLSETLIENAAEYDKALKRFNFAFLGVKNAIGNFLLPALTKLSQALTWLVGKFNHVYKHTKYLETLMIAGLAVALAKVVLWLNTVGTAGAVAWLKNIGPAILLAAAIAGVSLVLEDLYQALTGGKSAIGKWLDDWQGLGTTSELVRNIAAGIDSITEAIKRFMRAPWQALKGFAEDLGYVFSGKAAAAQDAIANRAVATGRGLHADAISNIDIPRALGRGLNADAVSSFGQARGSIFNAAGASRDSAPVNVTVNARTEASPQEIGRHVKRAIAEHQTEQARNLRNALVPRAAR